MAKTKKTKLVSGIGGFNTGLQGNATKSKKINDAKIKKDKAVADKAAAAQQKKVDAKRKKRDAAKK